MKVLKKIVTTIVPVVVGAGFGVGVVTLANNFAKSDENTQIEPGVLPIVEEMPAEETTFVPTIDGYNSKGEAYGRGGTFLEDGTKLDLEGVLGNHGKVGYIRDVETYVPWSVIPETLEDVEKWQKDLEEYRKNGKELLINVYESDGVAIIDNFTIDGEHHCDENCPFYKG